MTDLVPIACNLPLGEYAERLEWIAALNQSLHHFEQGGLSLELHYPLAEAARVQQLVERENSCCAFLQFEIRESATTIVLRIVAPAETRDAVQAIFAPFLEGTAPSAAKNGPSNGVA